MIGIRGLVARLTLYGTGTFLSAQCGSHPKDVLHCKPDSQDAQRTCFAAQWLLFLGDTAGSEDTLRPRGEVIVRESHNSLRIEEAMGAFVVLVMDLYHGAQEETSGPCTSS